MDGDSHQKPVTLLIQH